MAALERVFERVETLREEAVRLQAEMTSRVALGPENGGTGEHEKAAFLKGRLEALGPDAVDEIRAPDERAHEGYRPNLVARWSGAQDGPTIWVLSHMDIVPPGDRSLWNTDPYRVEVRGDRIYGRGVEDNQHGIVSSILGLQAVLDEGAGPALPVGLVFVADEETGSRYGLDYLLRHREDLFDPKDLIIVPDGGNDRGTMIEVAEKSMLWLKFTVQGRQCHASTPHKGRNSLVAAARLILALEGLRADFPASDPLFSPPRSTFEPTKMEANVPNVNTIPGKDVFYLDCRILPNYSTDEVFDACERIARQVEEITETSVTLEKSYRQEAPDPTPPDAPVVRALASAVGRVTGREARPMGIGGGTVAAFFRRAGFPAAVWSTVSDTAHQPNEYCRISTLLSDAKVFACLFLEGTAG
ncbi:MAG: M20 family metallo-hydrolase [Deltaproteobacteria bacterium]|nr:M20 family metallo-hydrolase [Deltaproteobacteria bacterium]